MFLSILKEFWVNKLPHKCQKCLIRNFQNIYKLNNFAWLDLENYTFPTKKWPSMWKCFRNGVTLVWAFCDFKVLKCTFGLWLLPLIKNKALRSYFNLHISTSSTKWSQEKQEEQQHPWKMAQISCQTVTTVSHPIQCSTQDNQRAILWRAAFYTFPGWQIKVHCCATSGQHSSYLTPTLVNFFKPRNSSWSKSNPPVFWKLLLYCTTTP